MSRPPPHVHGEEGVDRSSPSEGSAKAPLTGARMEPFWSFRVENARAVWPPLGASGGDPQPVAVGIFESAFPPRETFFIDGNTELLRHRIDVVDVQVD